MKEQEKKVAVAYALEQIRKAVGILESASIRKQIREGRT